MGHYFIIDSKCPVCPWCELPHSGENEEEEGIWKCKGCGKLFEVTHIISYRTDPITSESKLE
jgi:ribosomal protein L37AE/L43A